MKMPWWLCELVPRFTEDDIACFYDGNGDLVPFCLLEHALPGEHFDAVVTIRSFSWLAFAFFPTPVGDPRPFDPCEDSHV